MCADGAMEPGLSLWLQALQGRISERDDLLCIEVQVGSRPLAEIVWRSDGEELLLRGDGGCSELEGSELAAVLGRLVAGCDSFSITAYERMHTTVIKLERGKLSTRILPRSAADRSETAAVEPGTRQAFIEAQSAAPLLTRLGIMAADGSIPPQRRRKLFQVDRFVELVDSMIRDWPRDRVLRVLDCGSGKSYLSFVLNHYLTDVRRLRCHFTGIDAERTLVQSSAALARDLGYRNMDFVHSSIAAHQPEQRVDLVLSLHACDTATDEALALGVAAEAWAIVAVPCCQAALTEQLEFGPLAPMARHGVFRRQLAATITDGLRALGLERHGYRVSVDRYVSALHTPKNTMLRARKSGAINARKADEYAEACRAVGVRPWLDRILNGERPPAPHCHECRAGSG